MACRAHVGGTWRSKTVRLSACTKDNYITCKFFGMAYKALQDLILDTFSALSADLCRAPSPKHPEVFCGSLNPPCFKCLCSFVHPLLYQECLLLPTCLVASYCFLWQPSVQLPLGFCLWVFMAFVFFFFFFWWCDPYDTDFASLFCLMNVEGKAHVSVMERWTSDSENKINGKEGVMLSPCNWLAGRNHIWLQE